MRAAVVAALAAGGLAVGVVTAATVSVGSPPVREPLAPIVVETPHRVAPTAPAPPEHAPQANGVPAPPPALRPDERAGHKISDRNGGWDGDWADDTADDTWDDSWDDSWDDD